ncbi:MAG: flagellar biosynthesis anti-sigma factor FlgM [Comamonadaceae bacterium]
MKIDPSATFSKNVADPPSLAAAREGINANRIGVAMAALASQAQSTAEMPSLPSINGDFDAAQVARIRADISAGRYRANSSKIADGLLTSVRELIGSKIA